MAPSQRLDPYAYGLASGYSDLHTPFLGPPPREQKTSSYAKKSVAKWNMPEAYVGESEYLRDTMEDWMLTAKWTWYTERAMPWYRTDNIHLQWTEWENNAHYMGITPHQATSNVVTQKRSIRKADMVRRGIAAEFENDFVGTALGRTSFMASLGQMARSVQETANVEVIRALLGCHRYQQAYIRKHGIVREGELDLWWQRKAERFMIVQKSDFGMEQINTFVDQDQEKYNAKANIWILGREIMDYCSLVPEGKIYYAYGGQEAVDRINGRPQNGTAAGNTMGNIKSIQPERLVAGTPVFIAKSQNVDSVGQADLLSRTTEVGVFNTQIDKTQDFTSYKSSDRTIRVYDNDIDDWAEITLEDAVENCIIWDGDDIQDPFKSNKMRGGDVGRADLANDFLRHGSTGGSIAQDVEYFGDLDSKWLDMRTILGGAQTMLNTVKQMSPANARDSELFLAAIALNEDSQLFADARDADVAKQTNTAGKAKWDTYFGASDATGSPTGAGKFAALQTRIQSSIGAESGGVTPQQAEEKHQMFLTVTLGSVVPATLKTQLADIAKRSEQSWKDRAAAIGDLILNAFQEDPSSISALKSAPAIKQWIKNRSLGYEQEFNEWAATQVSSSSTGAAATTLGEERFFPTGTTIPEGYTVTRTVSGRNFPASLAEFTHLPHLFEGGEQVGTRVAAGGRRGGIGAALIGARPRASATPESPAERLQRLAQRFNNMEAYVEALSKSSAPTLLKWMAIAWLGCAYNRKSLLNLIRANVSVPFNALHVRVHATYRTRYGIKCQDDGGSGYTFFGHSNMQIEHEAARKVGMMHYTAYLSAVVMFPKNVYVVEDLYCEKYLGGMGTKFWSLQEYNSKGANRRKKSIVCLPLPPKMDRLEKKIDVRGYWYTEQRLGLVDEDRFSQCCYPGAARCAALLGWWEGQRSKGLDQSHRSRSIGVNHVAFQGVQFTKNPKTGDFVLDAIEQVIYSHVHLHLSHSEIYYNRDILAPTC